MMGTHPDKDAFDRWLEWAEKPVNSKLTIPAELHDAVMALSPDDGGIAPRSMRRRAEQVFAIGRRNSNAKKQPRRCSTPGLPFRTA